MPNKPSKAKTNTTPRSNKKKFLNVITFAQLKAAYPSSSPCDITGPNQCAVKVSTALQGAGASLASFSGACCKKDRPHEGVKHVLRAQELANWLKKRYLANWPKAINITGKDWRAKIENKTGIIFFKDYWLRKEEKYPTGDHIDLWDRDGLVSNGKFVNLIRLGLELCNIDRLDASWIRQDLVYSNLAKSKQILFWEIK